MSLYLLWWSTMRRPLVPSLIGCARRIRLGKNKRDDPKIIEAYEWANEASRRQCLQCLYAMSQGRWLRAHGPHV